jgi:hypothetical protein
LLAQKGFIKEVVNISINSEEKKLKEAPSKSLDKKPKFKQKKAKVCDIS